jgi:hypothetical protein
MDASARPTTPPQPGAIEDHLVDGCRAGGIGSPWPICSATSKTSSFLACPATAPMAPHRGPLDGLLVSCRCEMRHRAGGRPAGLGAQPATARAGYPGARDVFWCPGREDVPALRRPGARPPPGGGGARAELAIEDMCHAGAAPGRRTRHREAAGPALTGPFRSRQGNKAAPGRLRAYLRPAKRSPDATSRHGPTETRLTKISPAAAIRRRHRGPLPPPCETKLTAAPHREPGSRAIAGLRQNFPWPSRLR